MRQITKIPDSDKRSTHELLLRDGCTNINWQQRTDGNWDVTYELPTHTLLSVTPVVPTAITSEIASVTAALDVGPPKAPIASAVPEPQPAPGMGKNSAQIRDNEAVIPPFSVENVRRMFPGAPVENVEANLPLVLQALQARGLTEPTMVLYALATIRVETGDFTPKDEKGPDAYFSRYDHIGGNQGPDDGKRFKGWGFIQLTGRTNYTTFGRKLGIDLVGSPDLANEPSNAAETFAEFLESRAPKIRSALANGDLAAARKQVNGGTNGLETLRIAYQEGERLLTAVA